MENRHDIEGKTRKQTRLHLSMASSKEEVKLPSSFFEVYIKYKASTAVVLQWLGKNGALTPQSDLTTNELQGAVERIRDQSIQVPETVYRAFKDSIAKRRKVTDWFSVAELETSGKTTKSTANHVHYIEKLQTAFSTLFQDRKEDLPRGPFEQPSKPKEAVANERSNRFEILGGSEYVIEDPLNIASQGDVSLDIPQRTNENQQSTSKSVLQDDPLEKLIEIHILLRELDSICDTVKGFWEQASEGTLPLPLAAWLTNAAYECATRLCIGVRDIDKNAQEHQEVYVGVVNQLNIVFASPSTDSKYDDFTQGRGMTFPWLAIAHFKNEWNEHRDEIPKSGWQDPVKHISPIPKFGEDDNDDESRGLGKDLDAYKFLLTSMAELSLKENGQNGHNLGISFTPSEINPLLSDISTYLKSDDDHPSLYLVFGVHLLLEVSKSFIWKNETASTTNCRLQALRFAREVKQLVQMPVLPTNDPMVATMRDATHLDEYLAEKRFDLYYQSPWTAGFHMCEILHCSIDAGLRLCNSEGRVGAVLHMYNALRQLGSIDVVPLLDDLCEVFKREIFIGSLPTANFSSNFRRFLGGTVQLEPSPKSVDVRQGQRAIGLPASLPTAHDYVKRLMPSEISLFYELHNQRFLPTMDFWYRLYTGKPTTVLSKQQRDKITRDLAGTSFTEALVKMKSVIHGEFTGKFPIASLKYHAIFALCQQILKEMANLKFEEAGRDVTGASAATGFIFVESLLTAIVEHKRDTQMSKFLPHLTSLHFARRAILKFCSGKQLTDFVWKF